MGTQCGRRPPAVQGGPGDHRGGTRNRPPVGRRAVRGWL